MIEKAQDNLADRSYFVTCHAMTGRQGAAKGADAIGDLHVIEDPGKKPNSHHDLELNGHSGIICMQLRPHECRTVMLESWLSLLQSLDLSYNAIAAGITAHDTCTGSHGRACTCTCPTMPSVLLEFAWACVASVLPHSTRSRAWTGVTTRHCTWPPPCTFSSVRTTSDRGHGSHPVLIYILIPFHGGRSCSRAGLNNRSWGCVSASLDRRMLGGLLGSVHGGTW
jgi:hypothetical protein